jgi:uncharacterized protein (DUF2147 family)
MRNWIAVIITSCVTFAAAPLFAGSPDAIIGKWLTQNKKIEIEIYKAGDKFNGRIVWLKDPCYPANDAKKMGGRPRIDRENPDPSLRNRPLIGMDILYGFDFTREDTWKNGTVYDPRDGRKYQSILTIVSADELQVRGFIGVSLLGKTLLLKRAGT